MQSRFEYRKFNYDLTNYVCFHLKIRHFPDSNANASIGTVRKQRFASAGCCRIIILDAGLRRCFGKPGHQHTCIGLLQKNIYY